jgi:hypothetical protein
MFDYLLIKAANERQRNFLAQASINRERNEHGCNDTGDRTEVKQRKSWLAAFGITRQPSMEANCR